ncbi:MAG: MBL fold metallo-hydrolase [Chloroflexi bacterium]|nr:MBL fold metallo-hydrolase [Chloroflexota bacterium]
MQIMQHVDPYGVLDARLVFLGTGGGAHVERCHASVCLALSQTEALLLDTAGGFQIVRALKLAHIDLPAIKRVFLSHRHSDHLAGLEPLLLHIGLHAIGTGQPSGRVTIYGHPIVLDAGQTVLEAMASFAPSLIEMTQGDVEWVPLTAGETVRLRPGLTLTPFAVDHEPRDGSNLGCRVELDYGAGPWRIVYSGDTRPTLEILHYTQGADVLIHEAGGLDANAERVHIAGHSTAGEAARVAAEAGVRRLFLYHMPNEAIVRAIEEEARRYFHGPLSVPSDLESFALRDLITLTEETP